jgi:methylmalonyl-CoA mutase
MRIEEAATRKQARIDSRRDIIVGVNAYEVENGPALDVLSVDNAAVRSSQMERLVDVRRKRDSGAVEQSLDALTTAAANGSGNLLALSVEAARNRATLGEISSALEAAFGRYRAPLRTVAGVYSSETMSSDIDKIRGMTDDFARLEGRRPRILIAKMGQDGHDRGSKIVASALADFGFDVDIGPLFQTPHEVARHAVENDVHILGISSLAGAHTTLVPQLIDEMKKLGREDILIVVGGVIPPQDCDRLHNAGVAAVYGPGTVVSKMAQQLLGMLMGHIEREGS